MCFRLKFLRYVIDRAQTFGILEFTKCQLCFTFIRAVFRILSEN